VRTFAFIAITVVVVTGCVAGCGGQSTAPSDEVRVADAKTRLEKMLAAEKVGTDANPNRLATTWAAFKAFAAVPVAADDLSGNELSDGLLFEAATGDDRQWFELNFVRQFDTGDGDLQQLHLVVHFPANRFRRVEQAPVWSFDTGGDTMADRVSSWTKTVEHSPAFRRAAAQTDPFWYEIWQDYAE
jgi:hypothetical protein